MAKLKRLFWFAILGASTLVVWVLGGAVPEPDPDWFSVAPPIPSENDGYFTEFDG